MKEIFDMDNLSCINEFSEIEEGGEEEEENEEEEFINQYLDFSENRFNESSDSIDSPFKGKYFYDFFNLLEIRNLNYKASKRKKILKKNHFVNIKIKERLQRRCLVLV